MLFSGQLGTKGENKTEQSWWSERLSVNAFTSHFNAYDHLESAENTCKLSH